MKKLIAGFAIGLLGYCAYRQLQRTQTVIVNSLDQNLVPDIIGAGSSLTNIYAIDSIAGMSGPGSYERHFSKRKF